MRGSPRCRPPIRRFSRKNLISGGVAPAVGARPRTFNSAAAHGRRTRHAPIDRPLVDRRHLTRRDVPRSRIPSATPRHAAGHSHYRLAVNGTLRIGTGQPGESQSLFRLRDGLRPAGTRGRSRRGHSDQPAVVGNRHRELHAATRNRGRRARSERRKPRLSARRSDCRDVFGRERARAVGHSSIQTRGVLRH